LWNVETGAVLRSFLGHTSTIFAIKISHDGRRIFSTGNDGTVRIWDLEDGTQLRLIEFDVRQISDIQIFGNEQKALLAFEDHTLRLISLETGIELQRFIGHSEMVLISALLPNEQRFISGSLDQTVRLWDLETGRELRILEGHTGAITELKVLSNGQQALSASADGTLRLWNLETGLEINRFVHSDGIISLAILPNGRQAVSGAHDSTLRLWSIDPVGPRLSSGVGYTTARIALLGDSGVGKTGLGWRIAHGEFREHASTHGQQFWVVNQLSHKRTDGTECEAVLWDLAGQPDYRLIHTLFLDKADLALLLFDPANRERPLAGVEYWLNHLRSPRQPSRSLMAVEQPSIPTLLVAARADRGSPSLSSSEIEQFRMQNGIVAYVETSARESMGVDELIEQIKATIPWDELTAVTTTETFKRIKEYVLKLKETQKHRDVLLAPLQLRKQLTAQDRKWQFSDKELMTAIGHLANHGYVAVVPRTDGNEAILLAPDLLSNLASSIVLEARRHERGLGLIDETRLLNGEYRFAEIAELTEEERKVLLDAAASLFLKRNLCFRETINDRTCLVFPSLINEKRPASSELSFSEEVFYRVKGEIESVYPAMVVQLGYTNIFRRDHHWQNQAEYELEAGVCCSFRQIVDRTGEIELILSYSRAAGEDTRGLFQGIFERFLKRRKVQIVRFPAVTCGNGHLQIRSNLVRAIDGARPSFFCSECGVEIKTPRIDNIGLPSTIPPEGLQQVEDTAATRTNYEVGIAWVKAFLRDRGDGETRPTCFLSYAWGNRDHEKWVEELADLLLKANVAILFDRWHNTPATSISRYIEKIESSDFVCAIGTRNYRNKDQSTDSDPVVQAELRLIKTRLAKRDEIRRTIIPLLLEGSKDEAFPPLFTDSVFIDFRNSDDFFLRLFETVLTIHRVPFENEMARRHRETLFIG
jgi:small GTP-binding protein